MHKLSLAVLFCTFLAAASDSPAQPDLAYEIVYSVDGWPKMSTRADGKLNAHSLALAAKPPQTAPTGPVNVQPLTIVIPVGDPAALFMKHALEVRLLNNVLIEALPAGVPKPPARAPFAVRLTSVRVSSVEFGVAARGTVSVQLQPSRIEIFTATQTPTGATQPGQQFGWDIMKGKLM
jgi:hypothetical protein